MNLSKNDFLLQHKFRQQLLLLSRLYKFDLLNYVLCFLEIVPIFVNTVDNFGEINENKISVLL